MKHTITNPIAALLLLAVGLAGCSKEEALPDTPDNHGARLTISVTDGGYASASADGVRTRAVENGYLTTFTAGDKIGLYVVKPDGTYAAQNICLTLKDIGGKPTWQAPAGTTLYYEGVAANLKYFAYYPYQASLTGTLDPAATTAAGFFADVVSQWSPATDQSTHAKYTACDLMIGSGSISKQGGTLSLSFTMTHAMALVVIETPATKYTLSTDANYTWTAPAPNTKFNGFTPYSPSVGTYRYLVKPTQIRANDLTGSYTGGNGSTKEYTLIQNGLAAAKYAHYKVDGGSATIIEKNYTLQAGDFYMKDGSLVSKDEVTLTAAQETACIGIVYSTDASRIGEAAKAALADKDVTTPHGLVMALTNASEGCRWGNEYQDESGGANNPFQNNTDQLNKMYNNVNGYAETQWMVGKIASEGYSADTYKAFAVASKYGTANNQLKYAAPSNTTGWFLPSMGQWWDIVNNLGGIDLSSYQNSADGYLYISGAATTAVANLNTYLQRVDGATTFRTGTFFWSSSEYSSDAACGVYFIYDGYLYLRYDGKGNSISRVRCSLAF